MQSFTATWSEELSTAIKAANNGIDPYNMSLVGDDIDSVVKVVNQGIDGHLESCFIPDRGDSYEYENNPYTTRLGCYISSESLPVLIRRLLENFDDDNAQSLAGSICETLDIELI